MQKSFCYFEILLIYNDFPWKFWFHSLQISLRWSSFLLKTLSTGIFTLKCESSIISQFLSALFKSGVKLAVLVNSYYILHFVKCLNAVFLYILMNLVNKFKLERSLIVLFYYLYINIQVILLTFNIDYNYIYGILSS